MYFINKIRGGQEPDQVATHIKMAMGLCINDPRHMRSALDLNFASLLLDYALPASIHQKEGDEVVAVAIRALSTILFRATLGVHKEEAAKTNTNKSGVDPKKEKVCLPLEQEDCENLIKKGAKVLLRLTEYLKWFKTVQGKDNNSEVNTIHGQFLGFLNLVSKYCAYPSFASLRKPSIEALLACCVPEEDTKSLAVAAGYFACGFI